MHAYMRMRACAHTYKCTHTCIHACKYGRIPRQNRSPIFIGQASISGRGRTRGESTQIRWSSIRSSELSTMFYLAYAAALNSIEAQPAGPPSSLAGRSWLLTRERVGCSATLLARALVLLCDACFVGSQPPQASPGASSVLRVRSVGSCAIFFFSAGWRVGWRVACWRVAATTTCFSNTAGVPSTATATTTSHGGLRVSATGLEVVRL